jgi:Protein of unknown function (DUF2568)
VRLSGTGLLGATKRFHHAVRILLAISVPLTAAVVWRLIVAPRAPFQVGSVARFGVELLVFAAAIAALAVRHRPVLALILTLLYIINRVLIAVWHQ